MTSDLPDNTQFLSSSVGPSLVPVPSRPDSERVSTMPHRLEIDLKQSLSSSIEHKVFESHPHGYSSHHSNHPSSHRYYPYYPHPHPPHHHLLHRHAVTSLDVLFLLFETQQEQVHNRNQISCTRFLRDGFVNISKCNADQVEEILMHFLTTDPHNHKMIMYVGHSRHYCHLECGHDTILSEARFFEIICRYLQTSHLYLAFLCCALDCYGEDRIHHEDFLQKIKQRKIRVSIKADVPTTEITTRVKVLWDRTHQRMPTSFLTRNDFHVYRVIEEEIALYHDIRFYEE